MTKNDIFEEIKQTNIDSMVSLLMGDLKQAMMHLKKQDALFNKLPSKKWENNND